MNMFIQFNIRQYCECNLSKNNQMNADQKHTRYYKINHLIKICLANFMPINYVQFKTLPAVNVVKNAE